MTKESSNLSSNPIKNLALFVLVAMLLLSIYPDAYVYIAKKHIEIANSKQADLIAKTKNPTNTSSSNSNATPNGTAKTDSIKYTGIGEMGDSFGPINAFLTFLSVTILIIGLVLQSRELNQATQAQKKINETNQLNMAVEVIVDTLNHLGKEEAHRSIRALNNLPDEYCGLGQANNNALSYLSGAQEIQDVNIPKKRFDEAYKEHLEKNMMINALKAASHGRPMRRFGRKQINILEI